MLLKQICILRAVSYQSAIKYWRLNVHVLCNIIPIGAIFCSQLESHKHPDKSTVDIYSRLNIYLYVFAI